MAAAAFQSMVMHRMKKAEATGGLQPNIDSCLAYSRHGPLVRQRYPAFYVAKAGGE
jgi:hypothetical protein